MSYEKYKMIVEFLAETEFTVKGVDNILNYLSSENNKQNVMNLLVEQKCALSKAIFAIDNSEQQQALSEILDDLLRNSAYHKNIYMILHIPQTHQNAHLQDLTYLLAQRFDPSDKNTEACLLKIKESDDFVAQFFKLHQYQSELDNAQIPLFDAIIEKDPKHAKNIFNLLQNKFDQMSKLDEENRRLRGKYIYHVILNHPELIEEYATRSNFKDDVLFYILGMEDKQKVQFIDEALQKNTNLNQFFKVARYFTQANEQRGCLGRLALELPNVLLRTDPNRFFETLQSQENSSFTEFAFKHAVHHNVQQYAIGMGALAGVAGGIIGGSLLMAIAAAGGEGDDPTGAFLVAGALSAVPGAIAGGVLGFFASPIKACFTKATRNPVENLSQLDQRLKNFTLDLLDENQQIKADKVQSFTFSLQMIVTLYKKERSLFCSSRSSGELIQKLEDGSLSLKDKLNCVIQYMTTQLNQPCDSKSKEMPRNWGFRLNNGKRLFNLIQAELLQPEMQPTVAMNFK